MGDDTVHANITQPFYIGAHEVTQRQYEAVMGNTPSYFSEHGDGRDFVTGTDTSQFPVDSVSWLDAIEFCNKLSEYQHLSLCYRRANDSADVALSDGDGFRLPTEAEWEWACRGYSLYAFNTEGRLSGVDANINGKYVFVADGEQSALDPIGPKTDPNGAYLERTTTVGSYPPNRFGLFDMHGNVQEWCSDWYGTEYYKVFQNNPVDDPHGPSKGEYRVIRGGSWKSQPRYAMSRTRTSNPPDIRNKTVGFRIARNR